MAGKFTDTDHFLIVCLLQFSCALWRTLCLFPLHSKEQVKDILLNPISNRCFHCTKQRNLTFWTLAAIVCWFFFFLSFFPLWIIFIELMANMDSILRRTYVSCLTTLSAGTNVLFLSLPPFLLSFFSFLPLLYFPLSISPSPLSCICCFSLTTLFFLALAFPHHSPWNTQRIKFEVKLM